MKKYLDPVFLEKVEKASKKWTSTGPLPKDFHDVNAKEWGVTRDEAKELVLAYTYGLGVMR